MFLNFLLHEEIKEVSGVDVSRVRTDEDWEETRLAHWERWCRNWIVLKESPYRSIQ